MPLDDAMDWNVANWVKQEDANGCIIASLAMVTGRSYGEVRACFYDFGDRGALNFRHEDAFLFDRGFAWQTIWRFMPPGNTERKPWPATPWANLHIVHVTMPSGNSHSIVLLKNGTVLDPLTSDAKTLANYPEVNSMRAIYKVCEP